MGGGGLFSYTCAVGLQVKEDKFIWHWLFFFLCVKGATETLMTTLQFFFSTFHWSISLLALLLSNTVLSHPAKIHISSLDTSFIRLPTTTTHFLLYCFFDRDDIKRQERQGGEGTWSKRARAGFEPVLQQSGHDMSPPFLHLFYHPFDTCTEGAKWSHLSVCQRERSLPSEEERAWREEGQLKVLLKQIFPQLVHYNSDNTFIIVSFICHNGGMKVWSHGLELSWLNLRQKVLNFR